MDLYELLEKTVTGLGYELVDLEQSPRGRVFGVDPSQSMLSSARRREAPVEYGVGNALALPFPDERFDVVVCTQVYEYVEDIAAALNEARRVLRSGGRLLVLDTD